MVNDECTLLMYDLSQLFKNDTFFAILDSLAPITMFAHISPICERQSFFIHFLNEHGTHLVTEIILAYPFENDAYHNKINQYYYYTL